MARTSRNQMVERADGLRALAVERRNKGYHTGKSAAGWSWKRPHDNSFEAAAMSTLQRWNADTREALNDFQAACLNGPNSDYCDEIPL